MFILSILQRRMPPACCLFILLGSLFLVQSSASMHYSTVSPFRYNPMSRSSQSLGNLRDHAIPDECGDLRRNAYKSCLASIVVCAGCVAVCAATLVFYPICIGTCEGIGCTVASTTCNGEVGSYNTCCNDMKADPKHGWTVAELRNAALCGSCMSKSDVIKPICNQ